MSNDMIQVENENGEIKEAKLLNIININNQDYALYSLEKDSDNSDLYASRVIVDENGNKKFEDLQSNEEKSEIIKYIQDTLKN